MKLSRSFAAGSPVIRSAYPLSNDQIMRVAPSVFADGKHESRSDRYTYVPTIEVLEGLRKEGFQPFMVAQGRCRDAGKREFTKHMIRMRHVDSIAKAEANEIILLNSHDGTSSYQMVAGMLRFVCQNGLIAGDNITDIRIPHRGDIVGNVIEGAFTVLDQFAQVEHSRDEMRSIIMPEEASRALARAAIEYRWGADEEDEEPAHIPVTVEQVLRARRIEDQQDRSLWGAFNRLQENLTKGGMRGIDRNGNRRATRAVTGIAQDMKLNRALWTMAEAMRDAIKPAAI